MEDFDKEFFISAETTGITTTMVPKRMDHCIIYLCTQGAMDVEVDMVKYHCEAPCIINFFPLQVVSPISAGEDFKCAYIALSDKLFDEVLFRFPAEFIGFIKDNLYHAMGSDPFSRDMQFWSMIKDKFEDRTNVCRKDIIVSLLRVFFLEAYNDVYKRLSSDRSKKSRKNVIIKDFFTLILKYGTEHREVSFYAGKLCITPKYLSMVTMELEGKGAKECIDNFVITEIKLRLNSTSDSIQEIAEALHFPNQSFLCKYFRLNTGFTPTDWRKNRR